MWVFTVGEKKYIQRYKNYTLLDVLKSETVFDYFYLFFSLFSLVKE